MGVVNRRWVWVESMGVKYRFPHITYPYCAVMFAEGGGTVYVQASAINQLPRRTMLSPVATALINFLHFICFVFALFLDSTFVVLRRIAFTCCACFKYFCSFLYCVFVSLHCFIVLLHSSGL